MAPACACRLASGPPEHSGGRFHHIACFHAQQVAEKSLKALLVWNGIDPPRIHDLDELRDSIADGWAVRDTFPDLAELSFWGVQGRYPGEWFEIGTDEAKALVDLADALFEQVLNDLEHRGFDRGEAL